MGAGMPSGVLLATDGGAVPHSLSDVTGSKSRLASKSCAFPVTVVASTCEFSVANAVTAADVLADDVMLDSSRATADTVPSRRPTTATLCFITRNALMLAANEQHIRLEGEGLPSEGACAGVARCKSAAHGCVAEWKFKAPTTEMDGAEEELSLTRGAKWATAPS